MLCISRHSHCISATTQLSGSIRFFFFKFSQFIKTFRFILSQLWIVSFFIETDYINNLFYIQTVRCLLLRAIYSAGFCQFCLSVSSSLFNMIIANALIGLNRMIWVFCTSLLICSSQFRMDHSEITSCAQKFGMH